MRLYCGSEEHTAEERRLLELWFASEEYKQFDDEQYVTPEEETAMKNFVYAHADPEWVKEDKKIRKELQEAAQARKEYEEKHNVSIV